MAAISVCPTSGHAGGLLPEQPIVRMFVLSSTRMMCASQTAQKDAYKGTFLLALLSQHTSKPGQGSCHCCQSCSQGIVSADSRIAKGAASKQLMEGC